MHTFTSMSSLYLVQKLQFVNLWVNTQAIYASASLHSCNKSGKFQQFSVSITDLHVVKMFNSFKAVYN